MKYFGGCDVGSTYTKAVILDENGKMCADTTIRSKINAEQSAIAAMQEVCDKVGLKDSKELAYLIGTGYGRNKVPFADENISEISCHAMGVHVTNPEVRAIIDIGGQDVKGISIDTDGTVKSFAMNDKCSAGTGRFFEAMARSFEMSLPEFSNLSLTAKNVIPITAQCTVFAESEVITLVGEGKPTDEIAAGIEMAVAKRCFVMAKKAGATDSITLTGGCAKNAGLKQAIEHVLKFKVVELKTDPQLMGALGAAEYARPPEVFRGEVGVVNAQPRQHRRFARREKANNPIRGGCRLPADRRRKHPVEMGLIPVPVADAPQCSYRFGCPPGAPAADHADRAADQSQCAQQPGRPRWASAARANRQTPHILRCSCALSSSPAHSMAARAQNYATSASARHARRRLLLI